MMSAEATPNQREEGAMGQQKTLYLCDPSKNKECKKIACQIRCKLTRDIKNAKFDSNGKPIIKVVV